MFYVILFIMVIIFIRIFKCNKKIDYSYRTKIGQDRKSYIILESLIKNETIEDMREELSRKIFLTQGEQKYVELLFKEIQKK